MIQNDYLRPITRVNRPLFSFFPKYTPPQLRPNLMYAYAAHMYLLFAPIIKFNFASLSFATTIYIT